MKYLLKVTGDITNVDYERIILSKDGSITTVLYYII